MSWIYLLSVVGGYLLGSIPTGYLVGRRYGIDIREHGSRNLGATNVVRVLGKKPGYFVFLCDALKGLLAVRLAIWLTGFAAGHHYWYVLGRSGIADPNSVYASPEKFQNYLEGIASLAGILAGLGCVLGHNYPVWLRFRGGKGVATTIGVLLALMPAAFAVAVVVWLATFLISRYVSLASLVAAAALPVTVWWLIDRAAGPPPPVAPRFDEAGDIIGQIADSPPNPALGSPMFWFSVTAALLIFWRHRSNIIRLARGTESRFARKPPAARRAG